jgi:hypothetical protein
MCAAYQPSSIEPARKGAVLQLFMEKKTGFTGPMNSLHATSFEHRNIAGTLHVGRFHFFIGHEGP